MSDDEKTLNRFVLRARRIGAHSLARDRKSLVSLSELKFTGRLRLDGTMEMRRTLPDEEAFESLTARVRPLLVKRESIYYENVLTAVQARIDAAELAIPDHLDHLLRHLRSAWPRLNVHSADIQRFAVQSAKADGSASTPQVSDTQLVGAWLYGDLVHFDTHGPKSEGLLFPIKERYSAAVTHVAHAAVLTLHTLDLVMALRELGVIELAEDSLIEDVVVAVDELVENSVAYIGSPDAPMARFDDALQGQFPKGWHALTVTELLRQSPGNRVDVVLTAHDGSTVREYEAAVSRRGEHDGRMHWEALVAEAVTFEVSLLVRDGYITQGRFERKRSHASTNRMKFAEAQLDWEILKSERITFRVGGEAFFALDVHPHTAEEIASIEVLLDTLHDLVVIENITRRALEPLAGAYTSADRALLRRTRLLWEGQVVPFRSGPLMATAPTGRGPKVIAMPAANLQIGDIDYPSPMTLIRHPRMSAESITAVLNSVPPTDQMDMVPPLGEFFVAWAPEKRNIASDDDLSSPTPWALSHFDEQPFLGMA